MSSHVAVLMGGWSAEREVSLVSGKAVAEALAKSGYKVSEVDVDHDVASVLKKLAPDVVFNAAHGRWGEDGCLQGLLEIMEIPYTHSGVLASAAAMNKPLANSLFRDAGIPVPESEIITREALTKSPPMERPFVLKPLNEGSSVGVDIVMEGDNRDLSVLAAWSNCDEAMVERYIPGRELTVAVMGDKALGVTEIIPNEGFYDYSAKYSEGRANHVIPAPVAEEIYQEAQRLAVLAHKTLGCCGVSRADLRYDDTAGEPGQLYMLEINTQPGMTPLSLVPEAAAHAGIDFTELVVWMVEEAGCDR